MLQLSVFELSTPAYYEYSPIVLTGYLIGVSQFWMLIGFPIPMRRSSSYSLALGIASTCKFSAQHAKYRIVTYTLSDITGTSSLNHGCDVCLVKKEKANL